ncbi:nuclear transport factor 2 family protein [Limibaculum sp. M0105]|uniref:Nuclear transport factor 2 family protein n=1 Tax=Thermohalobaculum xanthum TaxID=2753746 RepID=A0A8J7M4N7_9RHOB|nr:nuclear transport factor 2 family protein [Thermohalobaculum xanthum]MBK0398226.1 nuclear transport factor 2 family protein [Thermohalobaculum xanthum]
MTLPEPIESYFAADARNDVDALVQAFAADAIVHDEGGTYRGAKAIRHWLQKTKAAYGAIAEPQERTATDDDQWIVSARVSGNFPGSPVILTFTFGLTGDRIASLEIH